MSEWKLISEHPMSKRMEQPPDVLTFGSCGMHIGRIYRYEIGTAISRVAHIGGEAGATHYMDLPEPPK